MKKTVISIALIFNVILVNAQVLEKPAILVKSEYSGFYETNIKKHAIEKWKEDYDMVIFEINQQCDALITLIDEFNSENTTILYNASMRWSHKGKDIQNNKKWMNITKCNLANLLQLECDWSMALYEYKKQVKAKKAI